MKKFFLGVVISISIISSAFCQTDETVIKLVNISSIVNKTLLQKILSFSKDEKNTLIKKIEEIKMAIDKNGDLANDSLIVKPLYEICGFRSYAEFYTYSATVVDLALKCKESLLKNMDSKQISEYFQNIYQMNEEAFLDKSILEAGRYPDCRGRCSGNLGGCTAVAWGTAAAGYTGCAALAIPFLVGACATGVSVAYIGGLVLCSNNYDECMANCGVKAN